MAYQHVGSLGATAPTCKENAVTYAKKRCVGKKGKALAECEANYKNFYTTWWCDDHTTRHTIRYFDPKNGKVYAENKKGCVACIRSKDVWDIIYAKNVQANPPVIKGLGGPPLPYEAWNIDGKLTLPHFANRVQTDYTRAWKADNDYEVLIGTLAKTIDEKGKDRFSVVGEKSPGVMRSCTMLDTKYPGFTKSKAGRPISYLRKYEQSGYDIQDRCYPFISASGKSRPVLIDAKDPGSGKVSLALVTSDLNANGYKSKYFAFNPAWFQKARFNPKTGKDEWGPDPQDIALAKADKAYARTMALPPTKASITFRAAQRKNMDDQLRKQQIAATTFSIALTEPQFLPQNSRLRLAGIHKWKDLLKLPICSQLSEEYQLMMAAKAAAETARLAADKESQEAAAALASLNAESEDILTKAGFSFTDAETSIAESNDTDTPDPKDPGENAEASLGMGSIAIGAAVIIGAYFLLRRG